VPSGQASELSFGIGYKGEYDDNIRLASTSPEHEWINTPTVGVAYREIGPNLQATIAAEAQYLNYTNETYEDAKKYFADAVATWAILPRQFHWELIDRADQSVVNSSLPATPDNLVNTNVLSTGPDFFLRMGQAHSLSFGARYGRASYSEGEYGTKRYGGLARWLYTSNQNMTYSLNYSYEKVLYDNDVLYENYDRNDIYARIDYHEAKTTLLMDLGYSHINLERTGETTNPLFRMSISQRITSQTTIGALLSSEYLDPAADLLATASTSGTTTTQQATPSTRDVGGDIYQANRAEAYYSRIGTEIGFKSTIFYRDIDYKVSPQDRIEYGIRLEITANPAGTLSASIFGAYTNIDNTDISRVDEDSEAGIRLRYLMTRHLIGSLQVDRLWRNSTDSLQEYINNRVLVSIVYVTNPMLSPIRGF
jgi:hypothetical protein